LGTDEFALSHEVIGEDGQVGSGVCRPGGDRRGDGRNGEGRAAKCGIGHYWPPVSLFECKWHGLVTELDALLWGTELARLWFLMFFLRMKWF
jgi:hypothetical protein